MNRLEEHKIVDSYSMKPGIYYSFYIEFTNKYDNIRRYAPVFEVEVLETRKPYEEKDWVFAKVAKITPNNRPKITKALFEKLEKNRLVQNHDRSCEYFSTREDAEKYHDFTLKENWSELRPGIKEQYMEKFYKKPVSKKETESLKFYDNLTKKQKGYVAWLSENKTF